PALPASMPANDVTVTAQWTINTFTVTFEDHDGTELKVETVDYGSDATAPAAPSRTGYSFTGWDVAFTNVTADITVTAQYSVNNYTVSFDSAGGTAVADVSYDFGDAVVAPADPTRTGYIFAGWSPALPATMPAEN